MVIAGPTDYSPMRAGAVSVVYGMPPPASGTGTMATGPPTLPASKPETEYAGNLPRPAPSFPKAPAFRRGDGGRPAPVLPPVAPPVPLAAPTAASAPLGALQAADPAAPSVAAERAIVGGGVLAQSEGSATTDVLDQPALPGSPAPPSALSPALVPPLPVLAGSVPAPPVAAPPAPPVAAPLAPPVAAPSAPPEAAPLAPPVAAPPAAGLSAPPVAVPIAPPVANPPVPSAQRPPSPGRRQQRPQSPARQDERETSRRRHNSPRRRGGPVTVQYPSLLPVDPPPPSVGAAHLFQALLGPQRTVSVPEVTLGQIWRLSEAVRVVHLVQVYGHATLSQGDSLVGGPRDDCLVAADRLAELLAPVLAAPAQGGLAGVGPLGSAVRRLRRLLHTGTGSGAIAAGTVLVRELHRTMSGLLAVYDADQM
ncbi:unnamed protein product [Closterium sp. Naga37s-1]|nr:unnamed protein product [Closterium sp. Naga37s-1]